MEKISNYIVQLFPFWILLGVGITLFEPNVFVWFNSQMITYGLGFVMLGMGLTLSLDDFKQISKTPSWSITGIVLQYTVMPFLGWFMSYIFNLPTSLAIGLIIVSCCPGGTASNVISYIAKANVALSVAMTTASTFIAIILTPLLTKWIVGSKLEVSAFDLFIDTLKVILIPVILGVLMKTKLPKVTQKILPFAPIVATIFIVLIVSSIIGAGKDKILDSGWSLLLAVFGLHAGGFFLGYVFSMFVAKDVSARRTISIEVGMQNSGLGVVLARNNFPDPATALPSAISSATHSLIGSVLAGIWRWRSSRKKSNIEE